MIIITRFFYDCSTLDSHTIIILENSIHIIIDNHSVNSPPVPLDFVNTEIIPKTRKYNTMTDNSPTIPTFREVLMNDERPLCMNRNRFVYR